MKFLLRLSALFAFALLGLNTVSATAQEEPGQEVEIELEQQELEAQIASHAKEIEAWAEKNAKDWESWAERFESKMERWAEHQEIQMEKWGETYAKRWEEWAAQMESGDFDADEMNALLEQNLKMISEMPLAELIESGLKEGLGELKNAPFESLGELQELMGGSLEQSLRAMEKELHEKLPKDLNIKLSALQTEDLHMALLKLQESLDVKNMKLDKNAAEKIVRLEKLMKSENRLQEQEEAEIVRVLERELANAKIVKEKLTKENAKAAFMKALTMSKSLEKQAKLKAEKLHDAAKRMEIDKQAVEASKKAMAASKKSLSRYYAELKEHKSELNNRDSEIETMRREIQMLRKEVKAMKKRKQKDD